MRKLKNWDNKTWLSSKNYISQFNKFLRKKVKFEKECLILDIGCGRGNIISSLQKQYKFKNKPIGVDIVKNQDIKKNIIFRKDNAIDFLKKNKTNYDLIILKQTIHLISPRKIFLLLNLVKSRLATGGKLLIFSLKTKKNEIPCFRKMKNKLQNSLKKDERLFKIIKRILKKTNESNFNYKVIISKQKYLEMVKSRYISCLLDLEYTEIQKGISELKSKYKSQIKFTDTLKCISFRK